VTARSDARVGPKAALGRAVEHLLALQHPDGWWKGELESNATIEAEDLFLREYLGIRDEETTRLTANWIRAKQRNDGTWANWHGGPGDLSTTIEAYAALRLSGDLADADHMRRAAAWVRASGGLEGSRVFTKIWFSLLGLWRWEHVPVMPPEMIFLPSWFPLNVFAFACWARQTVVALTVVSARRPVKPVGFTLEELRAQTPPQRLPAGGWSGFFQALDRVLHLYERRPAGKLRRSAMRRVERYILDRQEADGSWGGIQPPWVYSVIALRLLGYPLDHPVVTKALAGFEGFTVVEGDFRRLEACQSPVWDTALVLTALGDAGLAPDHPALVRARDWLVGEEIRTKGDWAVRRPELEPGGWAFEFANDWYPDIDDTAEVVLGLRRATRAARGEGAIDRAVRWLVGMQSGDGGWGAFDADNTSLLIRKLPFCDFGEVTDPPSADVTAHVVETLAREGMTEHPACKRGLRWLFEEQEEDGSWFGRWGANYTYGTGAVVPALVAAGIASDHPAIRRAVAWLEGAQNADGGWGEDLISYVEHRFVPGPSTASQTAWALLALHAAGEHRGEAGHRGLDFLVRTQTKEGTWEEPSFTGTGFPGAFLIKYHLYRLIFPVTALGRCLQP
jgi:squalene-hopene/tetraprenyl-beta-curcumene cyclase